MIDRALLASTCAGWGLPLDAQQLDRLASYAVELADWNTRFNLVAASTLADLTRRHLLDSLALATAWPADQPPHNLADVGSGAGLPGIPLAILWPTTRVTLIEATGKKALFLRHIAHTLPLPNVTVLNDRAEAIGQHPQHRERYDLVTARAVAVVATLAEYCLPLCRLGGWWLAPKGADIAAELALAGPALALLGGTLNGVYDVVIDGEPERSLLVIEKIAATPRHFPRSVGTPAKQPLS